MAKLEHNNPMLHKLNDEVSTQGLRPHAGLSGIGNECHRYLQLSHYWAFNQTISARIQRLFNVGHDAEPAMIADLARVGITVKNEQAEIIATAGHWKGHIDGEGEQEGSDDFLVEFKTHNDKSFVDLKKKKVKESKPVHFGQCQAYMGYRKLSKTLYMALNKNTSEYYIEWIDFDPEYFKDDVQRKELEVISAEELLPRIGNNNITWFACKFCSAKNTCFGKVEVLKSCRTCASVDVLDGGRWSCIHEYNEFKAKSKELTVEEQRKGCDHYELAIMFKEL